ncbi:hypothetical protein ANN_27448 [Periplaneta americana]|uniref:C2H2-type domain-containing protein n=1 Tax=Periplaneta americana TaxID=6978 RepID=A0ABQ8RW19_PERAM|nr:hypothetical protein ANN_27448 [Periplaneta americana]
MVGLCEGGNEPPGSLKASNMAQSVKALACRSEVALGHSFDPAWADYLVGFFPRFSPTVGKLPHLQVVDIKTECVDHSYDFTSEIKVEDFRMVKSEVEDTSESVIYPVVKYEVDENLFDMDRVQQEEKVKYLRMKMTFCLREIPIMIRVSHRMRWVICRDEQNLMQNGCYIFDDSIARRASRFYQCNICNEDFDGESILPFHPNIIYHTELLIETELSTHVDEIGDNEMVFGEKRPRIRHSLPGIHLTVGENLGKTQPANQPKKLRFTSSFDFLAADIFNCSILGAKHRPTSKSTAEIEADDVDDYYYFNQDCCHEWDQDGS